MQIPNTITEIDAETYAAYYATLERQGISREPSPEITERLAVALVGWARQAERVASRAR